MNRRVLKRTVRGMATWVSLAARVVWAITGEALASGARRVRRLIDSSRAGLSPRT